ncbi:RagB/SusD family nutrient uptake outer membrane protein [uncultured Chitinophaga sp.]|jgi:SusD family.|uniref:RagB/SusD family nutrient uptake outer membrane protein n=1 Tax=uncultured Chitinophaga sp. TaxID=339340 RepID=UPI002627706F|nr:RagB/SusD family nutrient uptake outer membrane protein [uncultured Chitinophaga sp.]
MKRYIIYACLLALLFTACSKDFLEKKNPNAVAVDDFWKTEADVLAALGSTYNLLRNVNTGYWGVRGVELSNGRGDDFFIRNDVKDLYSLSTFTNNPDNGVLNSLWEGSYQAIFRANQILERTDGIAAVSDENKKQYKAEARFLRALNYFILVTNFGDVPIRLTIPAGTEEYPIAKSPEAEVWKQIEEDLGAAVTDLPVKWPAEWTGRATKGAALGYLGKAYLYQKQWAKAAAAFQQLMGAPYAYNLTASYEDNFTATRENNEESVFEIQVQDVGGANPWATSGPAESIGVTTAQEFAPSLVSGWFEAYPTNKVLNEFKKELTTTGDFDPRMYATLVWQGQEGTFYKQPISRFFPTEYSFTSRFKKYQNWQNENELRGSGGGNYSSNINERALRFADILLMYAEALTMQGRPAEAYAPVKRIRDRAQLAALPAGYTQEQMMAEIRHQRMIEFCREGLRFYDLKRWGLLQQELTNSDKVGRNFYVPEKHDYYPIPQQEIDANGQMKQNPLW